MNIAPTKFRSMGVCHFASCIVHFELPCSLCCGTLGPNRDEATRVPDACVDGGSRRGLGWRRGCGGTLDGQADATHWWDWPRRHAADRSRLLEWSEAGTAVAERSFGDGHFLRPNFIQPYRCTNVLIEGVTIVNSPMWEIHPVLSTN